MVSQVLCIFRLHLAVVIVSDAIVLLSHVMGCIVPCMRVFDLFIVSEVIVSTLKHIVSTRVSNFQRKYFVRNNRGSV